MAVYQLGYITFHVSPVSIMQCWVGIGWSAYGSPEEIKEFQIFKYDFFPFLIAQDCEMPIGKFCSEAVAKIDETVRVHKLSTKFLMNFAQRLKGRLNSNNQNRVTSLSNSYSAKVREWLDSPIGQCGADAIAQIRRWGLQTPYRGLAAIRTFGNAVYGKYINDLKAVCVQLDVIAQSDTPVVQFLETLLHEEIHAAIHREMGDDDARPELTWMNELCAVLTSQEALRVAAKKSLCAADKAKLDAALDKIRIKQQYGELAEAVLRDTGDALIALKTWKNIFALSAADRRDYARSRIIAPILHNLGWNVSFPYCFGNKYVTVFI